MTGIATWPMFLIVRIQNIFGLKRFKALVSAR